MVHQALKKNVDLFAWKTSNMLGVSSNIISHKLSVYKEARPIAQKKHKLGEDKRLAAKEEAEKLLSVGFIRETHCTTWLDNLVMVRKANGKWRMCFDYTNLNKAWPKDSYPLPSIDRLVDDAIGNKILSFLYAYSSYNQISMDPRDKEKNILYDGWRNLLLRCHIVRSEKCRVNLPQADGKFFKGMIGWNVEVYVDSIVVKSDSCNQHVKDSEEVFKALRRTNMRLNPEKCAFSVEGGKFLGFMLTHRGIEANLEK